MSGTAAKIVYCIGLMFLAVCAVVPAPRAPVVTAQVVSTPMSTEGRLAKAIHQRINIEAAGQLNDYRIDELIAEESGLRQLAFADDAAGAREELIDSLADELSAAMVERDAITVRFEKTHPDALKMNAVVRALTAAINAEVRGISA